MNPTLLYKSVTAFTIVFIIYLILGSIVRNMDQFIWSMRDQGEHYTNGADPEMLRGFRRATSLASFENTLQAFPYLRRNMRATIMAELFSRGECYNEFYGVESAKFAILDNKVHLLSKISPSKYITWRVNRFKWYLEQVAATSPIPDMYFFVNVEDQLKEMFLSFKRRPGCIAMPLFVFSKNSSSKFQSNKFLLPDPYAIWKQEQFWYDMHISSVRYRWHNKIPKMLFVGAPSSPNLFEVPLNNETSDEIIFKYFHRAAFVMLSLQHQDVMYANFTENKGTLINFLNQRLGKDKVFFTDGFTYDKQVQYKFLLCADGYGATWRRVLAYLTSNSLMIRPYSDIIQWFYDKMIPEQHFVMLKPDLSDIFERYNKLVHNDSECLRMINNANSMARKYLTPEALRNFTVESLIKFAQVQKLNLTRDEKERVRAGDDLDAMLLDKRRQEIEDSDQRYKREWEKNARLASFEGTIGQFGFLKGNMERRRMAELMEKGCAKYLRSVLVFDNMVYSDGPSSNAQQKLNNFLIQKAKQNKLPNMFFLIDLQTKKAKTSTQINSQCRELPILSVIKDTSCLQQQPRLLIPNPQTLSPIYRDTLSELQTESRNSSWQNKTSKAYFRSRYLLEDGRVGPRIDQDYDIYQNFHEAGFVLLGSEREDLIDARFARRERGQGEEAYEDDGLMMEMERRLGFQNIFSESQSDGFDLTYKYQLVTDNPNTKMQQLLFSSSAIMKPLSAHVQWFYDKLSPGIHFVPVAKDLSDCFSKIISMNDNDTAVREMVKKANEVAAKYLTPEAVEKHFMEILTKYAAIQNLKLNEKAIALIKEYGNFQAALKM